LLEGTQLIESQLHLGLIEHLNSEICLGTITNLQTAISWLKSTFLFVRVQKNPEYYGFSPELKYRVANKQVNDNPSLIDEYLAELLVKSLTDLNEVTLVNDSDFRNPYAKIRPTINGQLMMRYYIRFETMKLIILKLDPQFVKQRSEGSDAVTLQDLVS
jgi:ATP-dependent DNA helicase HFM1/MER3